MAKRKPLDVKGYYRALRVPPDALPDEIRLAYAMAKQNASGPYLRKLDEAYEALKEPKRREEYDQEGLASARPLSHPVTLVAAIAVLVAAFAWLWLPDINIRRKSFSTGQTLVEMRTGREFGRIIRYNPQHSFPGGVTGPAYLVEISDTGKERWFPAIDLQATCDAR